MGAYSNPRMRATLYAARRGEIIELSFARCTYGWCWKPLCFVVFNVFFPHMRDYEDEALPLLWLFSSVVLLKPGGNIGIRFAQDLKIVG